MIYDKKSFLAGLQLGRRLKVAEARYNTATPKTPQYILTEADALPILTESGTPLLQQVVPPPVPVEAI